MKRLRNLKLTVEKLRGAINRKRFLTRVFNLASSINKELSVSFSAFATGPAAALAEPVQWIKC